MEPLCVKSAEYVDDLTLLLRFSDGKERVVNFADFFLKHPHPQYNKYSKISEFKKFWIRNGNVIWGKHADLNFPVNALYAGDLELCCDD